PHRVGGVRGSRPVGQQLARRRCLSGAQSPIPQGAGPALRPLLEGHSGSGRRRPLQPLPGGPRATGCAVGRDVRMSGWRGIRESTLYRGAYLAVSLAVLVLDQWTKGIVTRVFEVHQSRTVIDGLFDITYVRNSGAAFGLFASVDSSIKAII